MDVIPAAEQYREVMVGLEVDPPTAQPPPLPAALPRPRPAASVPRRREPTPWSQILRGLSPLIGLVALIVLVVVLYQLIH
jgi:hypothetical protein